MASQHPWGSRGQGAQPATGTGWAKAGGGEAGPQPPPRHPSASDPPGERHPGGQPTGQQIQGEVEESQAFNPGTLGTGQAGASREVTRATRFLAPRFQVNRCDGWLTGVLLLTAGKLLPGGSKAAAVILTPGLWGRDPAENAEVSGGTPWSPLRFPPEPLGTGQASTSRSEPVGPGPPAARILGLGHFGIPFISKLYQRSHVDTTFNNQERISLVVQWLRIRLPTQGTQVRSLVQEDSTSRGASL